jgi:hypothetical protein
MALKGDRNILETDITMACSTVQARGAILMNSVAGSGSSLGDKAATAALMASPSGLTVAGLLLNDVVNIDQTRFHLNFQKLEQQVGDRCTLLKKGRVTTNNVTGTPSFGQTAYVTTNGNITPTLSVLGGLAATPKVGVFASALDEDGYAAVDINLPIA